MPTKPNLNVPKTFLYVVSNPQPNTSNNELKWVPLVANEQGILPVTTHVTVRTGDPAHDKSNTSAAPNTDIIDPGSLGSSRIMGLDINGFGLRFNEHHQTNGSWSRERSNENPTVLSLTARTATVNSSDFKNYNARGAHFIVDVTAITATPSITVKIQGKDPGNGNYYDLLVSSAITAVGVTVLKVYPGITAVANLAANDVLPWDWRVRVEHADTDSITYSVGANLVL